MSRRVNTLKGQKRRRGTLVWVTGAVAFVSALLYWEQTALLYVLSTLAMCGLLLVVAFSDLEGRDKELTEANRQQKTSPADAGEVTAAAGRSVARRNEGATRRLKTTARRNVGVG